MTRKMTHSRYLLPAAQEVMDSNIRVDVALLSALIAGLGSEGLADEALSVFRKMVRACSYNPAHVKPCFGTSWLALCEGKLHHFQA